MHFLDNSWDVIAAVLNLWLDGKDCTKIDSAFCNFSQRLTLMDLFSADWLKKQSMHIGENKCVSGLTWLNLRGLKVEKLIFGQNLWKILNHTIVCDLDIKVFSGTVELRFEMGLGNEAEHYPSFYLIKLHSLINICVNLRTLDFRQSVAIETEFLLKGINPNIMGNLTSLTILCAWNSINKRAINVISESCTVLQELSIRCGKDRCRGSDFFSIINTNSRTLRVLNLSHCAHIDENFIEFISETLSAVLIELKLKNSRDDDTQLLCDFSPLSNLFRKCKNVQSLLLTYYKMLPDSQKTCRGLKYDVTDVNKKKLHIFGPNANSLFGLLCICPGMHEIFVREMGNWTTEVVCNMLTNNPMLNAFILVDRSFTVFTANMLREVLYHPTLLAIRIEGCEHFSGGLIQRLFEGHPDRYQIKSVFLAFNNRFNFSHMANITAVSLGLIEIGVHKCCVGIEHDSSNMIDERPLVVRALTTTRPNLIVKFVLHGGDEFMTYSYCPWA
jgi:hypothetical protein